MTALCLTLLTLAFALAILVDATLFGVLRVALPAGLGGFLAAYLAARAWRSRNGMSVTGPRLARVLEVCVAAWLIAFHLGGLVSPGWTGSVAGTFLAAGLSAWLGVAWTVKSAVVFEERGCDALRKRGGSRGGPAPSR